MNSDEFYEDWPRTNERLNWSPPSDGWTEPMRADLISSLAPWHHHRNHWNEVVFDANGIRVAQWPTLSRHSIANARLIATAPELLRQLELVLSVICSTSETAVFDTISIQKVIAKARGEAT